jgi:hypothetical protein
MSGKSIPIGTHLEPDQRLRRALSASADMDPDLDLEDDIDSLLFGLLYFGCLDSGFVHRTVQRTKLINAPAKSRRLTLRRQCNSCRGVSPGLGQLNFDHTNFRHCCF